MAYGYGAKREGQSSNGDRINGKPARDYAEAVPAGRASTLPWILDSGFRRNDPEDGLTADMVEVFSSVIGMLNCSAMSGRPAEAGVQSFG